MKTISEVTEVKQERTLICWYFLEYKIGKERAEESEDRPVEPSVEEI